MVMFFLGLMLGRLLWSGGFGWFVQQRMQLPLAAASLALVALGAVEMVAAWRMSDAEPDKADRAYGPKVGWLLVLPLLVLVSVAPTGLGAAAANRVDSYTPTESDVLFPPLDASAGPVEMRVYDFLNRALWDESSSLEGVPVRLEGLVVNDPDLPDGFKLTRFLVSCCAADGIPLQVNVRGVEGSFPNDTWVVAEVQWRPPEVPYHSDEGLASLIEADAISITVVPEGAGNDPYESPY